MEGRVNHNGMILSGSLNVSGGTEPKIEPIIIEENGIYNAPEGVDGYNPITVEVPERLPRMESGLFTSNGIYTPSLGYDGFAPVSVQVPPPNIQPLIKNITENGTTIIAKDSDVDGFYPITINVDVAGIEYLDKNVILVQHDGTFNNYQTLEHPLTPGNNYLAFTYREADPIPYNVGIFKMPTSGSVEIIKNIYLTFRSGSEVATPYVYSAGFAVTFAEVPDAWKINPFA